MYQGENKEYSWSITKKSTNKPVNFFAENGSEKVMRCSMDFTINGISYLSLHNNNDIKEITFEKKEPSCIFFKLTPEQTAKIPIGTLYLKLKLVFFNPNNESGDIEYHEKMLEEVKTGEPKRN